MAIDVTSTSAGSAKDAVRSYSGPQSDRPMEKSSGGFAQLIPDASNVSGAGNSLSRTMMFRTARRSSERSSAASTSGYTSPGEPIIASAARRADMIGLY